MATELNSTKCSLPTHLELPCTDGRPSNDCCSQSQNSILTYTIEPVLKALYPDNQYFIGQGVGIYFRHTNPPLDGCKAPDWFYIPHVSPLAPDGKVRRSYVLWHEPTIPAVAIEQVSHEPLEEWDETPETGKFWVYERVLKIPYYAIYDGFRGTLDCFRLIDGKYVAMKADAQGRFDVPTLNVSLGLRLSKIHNYKRRWLRFFDADGQLLLTGNEQMRHWETLDALEKKRAEFANGEVDAISLETSRLREQRARLGFDPDDLPR